MSPELEMKLKELAEKHIKAMAMDLVVELMPMAMDEVVAKSENKIDDAVVAMLKEPMKMAMVELIGKIKL